MKRRRQDEEEREDEREKKRDRDEREDERKIDFSQKKMFQDPQARQVN